MITPMSKYAYLVYHKEYDDFLLRLRDLGVVHVKENMSIKGFEIFQQILQQRKDIEDMLKFFETFHEGKEELVLAPVRSVKVEDYEPMFGTLNALIDKKAALQSHLALLEKDAAYMNNVWGAFDYGILGKLKEAGYNVTFYATPISEYNKEWEETYNAIFIKNVQSHCYFITITPTGQPIDLQAERIKLPELDLPGLNRQIEQLNSETERLNIELERHAIDDYNTFVELDNVLQNEFNFSNAKMQSLPEADEKLMLLEGWAPKSKATEMEQALDSAGYFFRKLDIMQEDNVPIELKNNKFAALCEPFCKMFSLPNYHEFDPTPFFAPFFMLFFGMCFGDAGYGLIMMLICTILKPKVDAGFKSICTLFQFLGGAALLVGTLTGTLFGIALVDVPMLSGVKDYFISSDNMMIISLVVGIINILFGKCVAALKIMSQKGVKYGIAPFAWVFFIAAALLAVALPMVDIILPKIVVNILYGIAAVGLAVALFYNSPGKNIFLNFGSGIWNMYNMASGLLGDTLSYIRLFAIGLTGAILGSVFNSLALAMTDGMGIIPKIALMAIILIFGHSLNFALCTISSLIHPLRLVFVEFYKNAGFEGGGTSYEPFRKM
jgi:Archaeal/vacuolar-type H+-ATPase subunit I